LQIHLDNLNIYGRHTVSFVPFQIKLFAQPQIICLLQTFRRLRVRGAGVRK
jgi:hypothetical protein